MGSHHQLSHSLVTRIDCISPTLLNPTHTLTMGGQEDELAQYNRVAELEPFGTPGSRMLEIERSKAAFGVDDLATYLYGKGRLEMMERIGSIVESEPAFDKKKLHYLGRKEKFEMAVNKEKRLAQLIHEYSWNATFHVGILPLVMSISCSAPLELVD